MVGIVFPGLQRREQLSDDDDGRIAHVVVDVPQAEVDGRLVRHRRHDDLIAVVAHDRLDELEVDRRHLRREDRVRLLALRCEMRALDDGHIVISDRLPARERRHERAQADARRAEIRDLVELDHRVDALMCLEDIAHLPRRDGIEATAKGTELDEREVRMLAGDLCRMVEACVIAPLVHDGEARALDGQMINGVLGKNGQMVALDHLRDAVIDFRIDVIRAADEQNGLLARALEALEDARAVVTHILTVVRELLIGRGSRRLDFLPREVLALEFLREALRHALLVVDWEERLEEGDMLFPQNVHVAADVLRIRRDDRAVVVVLRRVLLIDHVIRLARVEDLRDALFDEIHDMTVHELCRIAERVGGHSRHALVVHLRARFAGDLHAVAEEREEGEPERIILVHIEHARNADGAARRMLERPVVAEQPLVFIAVDIRRLRLVRFLTADAALAAVAREIFAAVGEFLHCDETFIPAAAAAVRARLDIEMAQFLRREQGGFLIACLEREDGCAVRAHDARDVGADDVAVEELLHAAQHGVVVERAALHDDMVAELAHILELHDLEERVLDDGERDARRDVRDLRALLLRLLDLRIHKDRAARAEVDRRLGLHGERRELRRRHVQPLGEVLDERAAARRARLVERDVADVAVLDEEAFHILAADVEHERDLRAELLRRAQVRERLDLAAVRVDAGLHDGLAVARRHASGDVCFLRQRLIEALQFLDDALERRAVIAAVGRVEELLIPADSGELRRRRAGVDADIDRPLVGGEIAARHPVAVVARLERLVVRRVRKECEIRLARFAGSRLLRARDGLLEPRGINGLRLV